VMPEVQSCPSWLRANAPGSNRNKQSQARGPLSLAHQSHRERSSTAVEPLSSTGRGAGTCKNLKGNLAIRPIFHQRQARVEAHIFIAFLAYCLHVTLTPSFHSLAPTCRRANIALHPDCSSRKD
jgi:hypothetical protein